VKGEVTLRAAFGPLPLDESDDQLIRLNLDARDESFDEVPIIS
jgi:hypothetical protein